MITEELLFQILMDKSVNPWAFQSKVLRVLKDNRNVLLWAPTGTGKTWAALLGFLLGWVNGQPHADKIIYALPLRSLATSLYKSTSDAVETARNSSHLSEDEKRRLEDLRISIQTGEQKEDPFFQGDICFTTIDQLLTGYLNIPASLPARLGNINTGALIGTLVVLDEIHLLEPTQSLATFLEIGRQLKGLTQFLLMSATLSKYSLSSLQNAFEAEFIEVSEQELAQMPGQRDKRRRFEWVNEPLTVQHIFENHKRSRSLVICNTVERAQQIFEELTRHENKIDGCTVMLLHSRFFKSDRKITEERLPEWFGPNAEHTNVILVTTQVVEAGVDISADVLHTELCPANSLLQRAGRCARYRDRNHGTVFVYQLSTTRKGHLSYGPYREKPQRKMMAQTEEGLKSVSSQILNHADERKLIDFVHYNYDKEALGEILSGKFKKPRREKMLETMAAGDRSKSSELVRDIDSVNIFIHEHPEELEIFNGLEVLSIPRSGLYRLERYFDEGILSSSPWIAKIPMLTDDENGDQINWKMVKSFNELLYSSWLIVIHPDVASYDSKIGFQWDRRGHSIPPFYRKVARITPYSYIVETYSVHVKRTIQALNARTNSSKMGQQKLAQSVGVSVKDLQDIEKMLCILHDAGKLREVYQKASVRWQQNRYPDELPSQEPLAHTTFNPIRDSEAHKLKDYSRGNHAAEGAYAVAFDLIDWLVSRFGEEKGVDLACVIVSAIARHHSPTTKALSKGQMIKGGEKVLNDILSQFGLKLNLKKLVGVQSLAEQEDFADILYDPNSTEKPDWMPLYYYLIRRLRLADQESFRYQGKEGLN